MVSYALFRDGKQISKSHSTREAVAIEAFELGVVGDYHADFAGDREHTSLLGGYEIKEKDDD